MMGADVANAGFRKTESRFAETGNSKFQMPNFKQILNSKFKTPNPRRRSLFRIWNLGFVISAGLPAVLLTVLGSGSKFRLITEGKS